MGAVRLATAGKVLRQAEMRLNRMAFGLSRTLGAPVPLLPPGFGRRLGLCRVQHPGPQQCEPGPAIALALD